jgi:DNA primase
MSAHDMAAEARSVRFEREIARRGIKLSAGIAERCGPCPVCGGTDRFSVNLKKQLWNCRRCERGGDIIAFVQHVDGSDFKEAVATLVGEPRQAPAPAAMERVQQPKKTYFDYVDEAGIPLSREGRLERPGEKKQTWQEAADPDRPAGQWINGEGCMTGVRRVPFQLPGLLKALKTGETIFIVEGPRKCELLHKWGLAATCNMGGSGAASVWREHAREFFLPIYNSPVVILPDNDAPGAKSAAIIVDALASVGVSVSVLDLPVGPKGDVID